MIPSPPAFSYLATKSAALRDVLFHFLRRHADAVIFHGQRLGFLIRRHRDAVLLPLGQGVFPEIGKLFQLGDGVRGVGDDLAEKDVLFGIEPFFDDREYIFTVD